MTNCSKGLKYEQRDARLERPAFFFASAARNAALLLRAPSIAIFARRLRGPFAVAGCAIAFVLALHQVVDSMWIYPKVGILFWVLVAVGATQVDAKEGEPVPTA